MKNNADENEKIYIFKKYENYLNLLKQNCVKMSDIYNYAR